MAEVRFFSITVQRGIGSRCSSIMGQIKAARLLSEMGGGGGVFKKKKKKTNFFFFFKRSNYLKYFVHLIF